MTIETLDPPVDADQNQAIVRTPEDVRREVNERNWLIALGGLERATAWLKEHRARLCSFHVTLQPVKDTGITVNLSFFASDDERAEVVKSLFAGKRAEKKATDNGNSETFTVVDGGLRFRWTVWRFKEEQEPTIEEVTI